MSGSSLKEHGKQTKMLECQRYGFHVNCVNDKMLESDWFLKALIYGLIWQLHHHTVRFDLSD